MYGFLLETDGFSVLSAPDGPTAIDLVRSHGGGIDLVVTEYMMPGTGGLEAWRELRSARPGAEPEVLFLAGDPHKVQEALRAEGLDRPVLAKPFHPDAFLNVVRALVGPRSRFGRVEMERIEVTDPTTVDESKRFADGAVVDAIGIGVAQSGRDGWLSGRIYMVILYARY